jgi:hypothetical protein
MDVNADRNVACSFEVVNTGRDHTSGLSDQHDGMTCRSLSSHVVHYACI